MQCKCHVSSQNNYQNRQIPEKHQDKHINLIGEPTPVLLLSFSQKWTTCWGVSVLPLNLKIYEDPAIPNQPVSTPPSSVRKVFFNNCSCTSRRLILKLSALLPLHQRIIWPDSYKSRQETETTMFRSVRAHVCSDPGNASLVHIQQTHFICHI